ncbi:hypothetical protein FA15DRAFT_122373 [Coprinopsis marcescibilis]|uniref:Uncharacterized protein n=1 Tax=Coprinopsis marcescibilis TaxID=230819 RepID=A0A5C3KK61_COPMA|nr:hypothetical protein FA15DRAFT_122373 [Coprinopsis marcescibilis]
MLENQYAISQSDFQRTPASFRTYKPADDQQSNGVAPSAFPRRFLAVLAPLLSLLANLLSSLCDITKRCFSKMKHMQRPRRHGNSKAASATSPRPALQEFKNIYPLPSSNDSSESFFSTASLPLPPHFFRNSSSARASRTKTKPRGHKRSDTMPLPRSPSFIRKMLSINFRKDKEQPNKSDLRSRKNSAQVAVENVSDIRSSGTHGYTVTSNTRVSSESTTSTASASSTESGIESDATLCASDEDLPASLRKFSIQTEYTSKVYQHTVVTSPEQEPIFTNVNPFNVPPKIVSPSARSAPRKNPRPAYKLSDFLATKRASALIIPPDHLHATGCGHELDSPSSDTDTEFENGKGFLYSSNCARRASYNYESGITALPIPPWHRLRRAEVVFEPED